jgi:sulfite reductase alpha subunit-like flavoprotein
MLTYRAVYVLYGSQTGNAESIAKDISEKLNSENVPALCSDLNAVKGKALKELAFCMIIVCATTGNGDAPENANDWWRTVKLRSAVSISTV